MGLRPLDRTRIVILCLFQIRNVDRVIDRPRDTVGTVVGLLFPKKLGKLLTKNIKAKISQNFGGRMVANLNSGGAFDEVRGWLETSAVTHAPKYLTVGEYIGLNWEQDRDKRWGIRINHGIWNVIHLLWEKEEVRFISIISLDDQGTPLHYLIDGNFQALGFQLEQDQDRLIKKKD